jgi:hypothetical protein
MVSVTKSGSITAKAPGGEAQPYCTPALFAVNSRNRLGGDGRGISLAGRAPGRKVSEARPRLACLVEGFHGADQPLAAEKCARRVPPGAIASASIARPTGSARARKPKRASHTAPTAQPMMKPRIDGQI